jgi:parvulin-like peptidyl-prolyl isomerase
MLDFLRRNTTSLFAWLILGIIALVFGLSFGLPSESLTFGPGSYVKVYGENIGDDEYRYELTAIRRTIPIPEDPRWQELAGMKEEVLEAAIERELLARAAEDVGLAATKTDAENLIGDGHMIVLARTIDYLGDMPSFNYDVLTKSVLPSLQVTEPKFIEIQRRELLARTMRDLVEGSVVVPEGELRKLYDEQANRISLRYARYEAAAFGELIDASPEEIDAYVAANGEELKRQLASQGARFTKLSKQARVGIIELRKPEGTPTPADLAAVRTRAAAALERIRGNKQDFRAVAREVSEHDTARRGGDFGWVSETTGTGIDPVVDETLPKLEIGAASEVLEGESAFYVVRVGSRREGDVPEADALRELAEEAVARDKGKELARAAAEEDLAAVGGGTPVGQVFASETEGIEGLPLDTKAPGEREKVAIRETGMFGKGEPPPGLGAAPEIVEAAWAASGEAPLIDRVFEIGDGFALVGVVDKEAATDEGFTLARAELYKQARRNKGLEISARYAQRRCLEAKGKGDIEIADEKVAALMTYDSKLAVDEAGNRVMRPYSVCDRVGNRGGLLQSGFLAGRGQ